MPGPHFNSKRLQNARNVRAEFAPGSVPRVGTRLFAFRLLPRTVESNCGCQVRQSTSAASAPAAPAAPALPSYAEAGALINNNEIVDPLDVAGTSATHTSFIQTRNLDTNQDYVIFTKPGTTTLHASEIDTIYSAGNGRKYKFDIVRSHDIATLTNAQINFVRRYNSAQYKNNNQLLDQNNLNNNGTDTIFETYKVKVGDVIATQDQNNGQLVPHTITTLEKNANGKILSVRVTPNHGTMAPTNATIFAANNN